GAAGTPFISPRRAVGGARVLWPNTAAGGRVTGRVSRLRGRPNAHAPERVRHRGHPGPRRPRMMSLVRSTPVELVPYRRTTAKASGRWLGGCHEGGAR